MRISTESEVRSFLLSVKYAIQDGNWRLSWSRPKNKATIAQLGMDLEDIAYEIESLSVTNYHKGPSKDKEFEGDVWEFGKAVAGKEVYIKLKLVGDQRQQIVNVISFHFSESPLSYPFKQSFKNI